MNGQQNIDSGEIHTFLALVPRGLEEKISSIVKDKISDVRISFLGEGENSREEVGLRAREAFLLHQHKKQRPPDPWFDSAVGSIQLSLSEHVSIGYTDTQPCTWSVAGTMEGSVWMKIQTCQISEITSLRCLGPLMALVGTSDDMSTLSNPTHSKNDLILAFSEWISSVGEDIYHQSLESSLRLWRAYVSKLWTKMLDEREFASLQERIQTDMLRFRVSCMRDHVDATYARQDFLKDLMEELGPSILLPSYLGSAQAKTDGWKVNLKDFDVELVVILLTNGFMAMGISLLPYPAYNAKSFATGVVPPDITTPYLGGESLDGLVRLRPTTAHILLDMANVQAFETVLDPCAGIGTIPIEAEVFFNRCIGLGGDVVLHHHRVASTASAMEQLARKKTKAASSLLASWDAAHLPVRSSSIDVCVSDLPFGKQCLSSNALKQLLPLLFLESARVLIPEHGRMLILCGSPSITDSLWNSKVYWKQPCTIATPVTIGGLQAWIFRVERSDVAFNASNHPTKLEKVRALAKKRDRVARHHYPEQGSSDSKKRRIQS
jgi:hypothetical protein